MGKKGNKLAKTANKDSSKPITVKKFRKVFQTDVSKFRLSIAITVLAVFLIGVFLAIFQIWFLLDMNYSLLSSYDFSSKISLDEVYYDYFLREILRLTSYFSGLGLVLFFLGSYIASLLLRPFQNLADYCENAILKPNYNYSPDRFSDLRHLTRFSDYFFNYIQLSRTEKRFLDVVIPSQYEGIRKPVFEKVFFFHFFLIFLIVILLTIGLLNFFTFEIHADLINLSMEYFTLPSNIKVFILKQKEQLTSLVYFSSFIMFLLYAGLAFYLYSKVSGAAFGVFATFKSYMKGHYHNRVQLIGFNYLRPSTRMINRFLESVKSEIGMADSKEGERIRVK